MDNKGTRFDACHFYTVSDLSARWKVSERHVRRLIKHGDLVPHGFGQSKRIAEINVACLEHSRKQIRSPLIPVINSIRTRFHPASLTHLTIRRRIQEANRSRTRD